MSRHTDSGHEGAGPGRVSVLGGLNVACAGREDVAMVSPGRANKGKAVESAENGNSSVDKWRYSAILCSFRQDGDRAKLEAPLTTG